MTTNAGDERISIDVKTVAPKVKAAIQALGGLRGRQLHGALTMLIWAIGGVEAGNLLVVIAEMLPQMEEQLGKTRDGEAL